MTKTGQYQRCISAIHWLETGGSLALLGATLMIAAICTPAAQAQTYTVLYQFKGSDGAQPYGRLVGHSGGNLYGTTGYGGTPGTCPFNNGCGTVFKLDTTGKETVLHSFTAGSDGKYPDGLIRDSAGNLYGTTSGGNTNPGSYGGVFKLDTTDTLTVLYDFTGRADGANPTAAVIRDSAGNLYGTTRYGGIGSNGVVFKLDTTGKETVLHSFTGGADGSYPNGLIRDSAGYIYGTTYQGGVTTGICSPYGCGVIFKLDTAGKETVLYSFTGGADGANPEAAVIRDSAGNLYGTAYTGGSASVPSGNGVVFKLDTAGTETVLDTFKGGADGANPQAGVIRDSAGNLYGSTYYGGNGIGTGGHGVVFKLDITGTETVLHTFTGGADGANPGEVVIRDSAGNLYGTTLNGGIGVCNFREGCGVVFKLKP